MGSGIFRSFFHLKFITRAIGGRSKPQGESAAPARAPSSPVLARFCGLLPAVVAPASPWEGPVSIRIGYFSQISCKSYGFLQWLRALPLQIAPDVDEKGRSAALSKASWVGAYDGTDQNSEHCDGQRASRASKILGNKADYSCTFAHALRSASEPGPQSEGHFTAFESSRSQKFHTFSEIGRAGLPSSCRGP
jgi:hypothetical protein